MKSSDIVFHWDLRHGRLTVTQTQKVSQNHVLRFVFFFSNRQQVSVWDTNLNHHSFFYSNRIPHKKNYQGITVTFIVSSSHPFFLHGSFAWILSDWNSLFEGKIVSRYKKWNFNKKKTERYMFNNHIHSSFLSYLSWFVVLKVTFGCIYSQLILKDSVRVRKKTISTRLDIGLARFNWN